MSSRFCFTSISISVTVPPSIHNHKTWTDRQCDMVQAPSSLLSLFALLWKYVVIQSLRHENQKGVSDIFGEMDGYIYIYI